MASCLITIAGTSGELEINYILSAVPYSFRTGIGTIYIESTATNITYTTLSGDVTATTACGAGITSLPATCYLISWKGIETDDYQIDRVSLGVVNITIPDTPFPISNTYLPTNLNGVDDDRVKITGYKKVSTYADLSSLDKEFYYLVRVLGTDPPIFRVKNTDASGYIYIHGVAHSCTLPVGYTAIDVCDSPIPAP